MMNIKELEQTDEFKLAYEDWCLRKSEEAYKEKEEQMKKEGRISEKMTQIEYMRSILHINVPDDWKRKPKYNEDEKMIFAYLKSKKEKK